jgi:PAS domain S-box-containing protein
VVRALQNGANDYITKPFKMEPLTERVRTQLELAESRRALETEVIERRRIQARLEQMAAGLKAATRSAGIGVWEWAPSSGELLWDRALRELLGLDSSSGEVVEGGWGTVVHPDDLQRLEGEFQKALSKGEDFHSTFRIIRPDGAIRHLEGHASVQSSAEGDVAKLIGANWDITERNQARQAVLEASERERKRIGRDLHDGLCQELGGLGLLVSAMEERLRQEENPEAESAIRLSEYILQATEHARGLAHGLSPLDSDRQTLSEALEGLISKQQKATPGIKLEFSFASTIEPLPSAQATELYFIASEAFANAIRHGSPGFIRIGLSEQGNEIVLTIFDDGGGSAEQLLDGKGLGIHSMRHRAWTLGGAISFETERTDGVLATQGIRVECRVPKDSQATPKQ